MAIDTTLHNAISKWLPKLNAVEGWLDWKRKSMSSALWLDDEWHDIDYDANEFKLPPHISREHNVIVSYYNLYSTLQSLQDCQYYFRRFPFAGLPVEKHEHLRYVCEMYFNRFYEFGERLKKLFEAIKNHSDEIDDFDYGTFIKRYKKEFMIELKERNSIHHNSRFEDLEIDNILLLKINSIDDAPGHWKKRNETAYRKYSKEWSLRVIKRSKKVESYLTESQVIILEKCKFLRELI